MNDYLLNKRLTMLARLGRNALMITMFAAPVVLPFIL